MINLFWFDLDFFMWKKLSAPKQWRKCSWLTPLLTHLGFLRTILLRGLATRNGREKWCLRDLLFDRSLARSCLWLAGDICQLADSIRNLWGRVDPLVLTQVFKHHITLLLSCGLIVWWHALHTEVCTVVETSTVHMYIARLFSHFGLNSMLIVCSTTQKKPVSELLFLLFKVISVCLTLCVYMKTMMLESLEIDWKSLSHHPPLNWREPWACSYRRFMGKSSN